MPARPLFNVDDLGFIHRVCRRLSAHPYSPEQLDALQVAFFGLPELPGELSDSEALIAWQERVSQLAEQLGARGQEDAARAILAAHPWREGLDGCKAAHQALRAEGLRLAGGFPTAHQLTEVRRLQEVSGCTHAHDRAAFLAYLTESDKPTPAEKCSAERLARFCASLGGMSPDERAACLMESRRFFRVTP